MERTHAKNLLKSGIDYTEDLLEIDKAKEAIGEAEEALKEAKAAEAEAAVAQSNAENAQSKIAAQQDVVNELQAQFDLYKESFDYDATCELISSKQTELENLEGEKQTLNSEINVLNSEIGALEVEIYDTTTKRDNTDPNNVDEIEKLNQEIELKETVKENKEKAVSEKIERLHTIEDPNYAPSLENEIEELKDRIAEVKELDDRLAEAKATLASYTAAIENGQSGEGGGGAGTGAVSVKEAEKNLKTAQESLEAKQRAFAKKQEEDALKQQMDDIDMKKEMEDLEAKRKEVQKLKDHDDTACIVAPDDGIITGISLKEGDKVSSENPIATIQLATSGYEVSAVIPKTDGKLIRVGDEAYLENVWSEDASASVKSIKADPSDPNKNLIVKFEVKGNDISVGQTIQFAVGEKSQKYDTVVPNNAVKEDIKGNFVLVVKVKSTPLGNRYTVKKVEVTKLASDTTKCAIQGDVSEYDNVVTNATKRLENGQQVRLSEKQ